MSSSTVSPMPNRPYRVSSRAALTSPSLPLAPWNPPASRIPPLPHEQSARTMSSQRSMDFPRHDLPSRAQNFAVQTSLAQSDHLNLPAAGPQLPQLLSSKPAPNRVVYNKLRSVKSFFRRQPDDDNNAFDSGRGADSSTNSEPEYRSSMSSRPRFLQHSTTADTPPLHSVKAAPSHVPSESFFRSRTSSSQSRPLGATNDHVKQFNRDTYYLEFESLAPPLPLTPHSASTCSSREDSPPNRGNHEPSIASKPLDSARAALHPSSKQVTSKLSLGAPGVITVPESYGKPPAPKTRNAEQSRGTPAEVRSDCVTFVEGGRPRGRRPTASSVASSSNHTEKSHEPPAYKDDSSAGIGRLRHDRSVEDDTSESFEINVAQELKPTAACKLVLGEPGSSSLTVNRGESSAGSSLRSSFRSSSPSGFTNCDSNRDEYMSPCSSLPSPRLPLDEEYINIRQIRQVMKGLQSLLEKIDPEAKSVPEHTNGIPSDQTPTASSNSNHNFRINHAEFLRVIKSELDR